MAVKFVTNTTKECKRTLHERLRRLQFEIEEQEIFTSLTAARKLLEHKSVRPLLLVENSALEDFAGELRKLVLKSHCKKRINVFLPTHI